MEGARRVRRHRLWPWLRAPLPLAAGLALWLVPITPVPIGLRHQMQQADFLGDLWQVVATTVALSAAVVLVVFETFPAAHFARYGVGLREFIDESGLLRSVFLGFATIVGTGLVLAGGSGGDGSERAAVAVTLLALWALCSTGLMVTTAARLLSEDSLARRRRDKLLADVQAEALATVRADMAGRLLEDLRQEYDVIPRLPMDVGATAGLVAARPAQSGWVTDIRLRELCRVLTAFAGRAPRPELAVIGLGSRVEESDGVVAVPAAGVLVPGGDAYVELTSDEPEPLELTGSLDALHEDARGHIADDQRSSYAQTLGLYAEVVAELPRAWRRAGGVFEEQPPVRATPLDTIREQLAEQAGRIAQHDREELAAPQVDALTSIGMAALKDREWAVWDGALSSLDDIVDAALAREETPAAVALARGAASAVAFLAGGAARGAA